MCRSASIFWAVLAWSASEIAAPQKTTQYILRLKQEPCILLMDSFKDGRRNHCTCVMILLPSAFEALCQDEILLNIVLETSARHKDFKRIEWTVDLFEKSNMRPSTPTYGSLIKAYGMLKCPEKCWAAWKQMTEMRGLKPTHIVIGCMLDALVCNGLIDDAERIFEEHAHPPNMILRLRANIKSLLRYVCTERFLLIFRTSRYSILFKGFAATNQPTRIWAFCTLHTQAVFCWFHHFSGLLLIVFHVPLSPVEKNKERWLCGDKCVHRASR